MKWLRSEPATGENPRGGEGKDSVPARRAAPALAAVFEGLSRDGERAVLDLGPATQAHLHLYGRFADRIRFQNLLPRPPTGAEFRGAVRELASDAARPYDVVLIWNLLDWLHPERRADLIEMLARITAPGARLYTVVHASEEATIRPVRFTPVDLDRVSLEVVGPPVPTGPPLLPATLEKLLRPFEVRRAFTLRGGHREYAAVKGDAVRDLSSRRPARHP